MPGRKQFKKTLVHFHERLFEGPLWVNYLETSFTLKALELVRPFSPDAISAAFHCIGRDISRLARFNSVVEMFENCDDDDDSYYSNGFENKVTDIQRSFRSMSDGSKDKFQTNLINALEDHMEHIEHRALHSEMQEKFDALSQMMDISRVEEDILRLVMVLEQDTEVAKFFEFHLDVFNLVNKPLLSKILNATRLEISRALNGKLGSMQLLDVSYNCRPCFQTSFYRLLEAPDDMEALASMAPVQKPLLEESDFYVKPETTAMLKNLLAYESPTPTHVLFYGPAGVGKTQFARTIAQSIGIPAYEVKSEKTMEDHRSNLILADAFIRHNRMALLIIDEADELINELNIFSMLFGGKSRGGTNSKSWLDDFMEKPGSKCLWIANNPKFLSDTVLRRFSFSLGFPNLGKKERSTIWTHAKDSLTDIGSGMLTDTSISKLADELQLSPGVISQSLRKSLEAGPKNEDALLSYVHKMTSAHLKLAGQTSSVPALPDNYRLEGLNSNPSAQSIIEVMEEYVAVTSNLPEGKRRGIKFLFHGIPGTGKTELAHYIARQLDVELVHGRLSNILSPFSGESENNLANLFEEAQALGGILLIDEVESFLSNRSSLHEHFSMLLVNEFLLCLERFTGIFIGSTNNFGIMDPAAVRRFTFKVEFRPLGQDARLNMFDAFFLPLSGTALSEGEAALLSQISYLTPADFANTASRAKWHKNEGRDNHSLLESLKLEASYRSLPGKPAPEEGDLEGGPGEGPGEPTPSVN